jgi:hypothetical protein
MHGVTGGIDGGARRWGVIGRLAAGRRDPGIVVGDQVNAPGFSNCAGSWLFWQARTQRK